MLRQCRQAETIHYIVDFPIPFLFRLPISQRAGADILPDRHIRKKCIVLEHQPGMPLLRCQVDMLFRIKQGYAVQHNSTPIRFFYACNASEGKTLSAT